MGEEEKTGGLSISSGAPPLRPSVELRSASHDTKISNLHYLGSLVLVLLANAMKLSKLSSKLLKSCYLAVQEVSVIRTNLCPINDYRNLMVGERANGFILSRDSLTRITSSVIYLTS